MSKALVIKGANFEENKVETITLINPIPCTGLSISPTSHSFTAIGATQQITATVTPNDTTDGVYYSSSDTDVATVSDSGLVTCVGVGSATITVTCGNQSVTCQITSTITLILDDTYAANNGYKYSGSVDIPNGRNYAGLTTDTYDRCYWNSNEYGTYRAFIGAWNDGRYAIPLPKNTKSITFTPPDGLKYYFGFALLNVNEKQTYAGGADGQSALAYYGIYTGMYTVPKTIDISSYPNANGYIVSFGNNSQTPASEITGKTTVTYA